MAFQGLVLYWKCDETSGSTLADESGLNHAGSIASNGTLGNAGVDDSYSLYVRTSLEVVSTPDSTDFDFHTENELTVAFWYKPTAGVDSVSRWMVSQGGEDVNWGFFQDNIAGGSSFRFYIRTGTGLVYATVPYSSAFTIGEWTHVVGSYDGANIRLYIDGVEVAVVAETGTITDNTGGVRIGATTSYTSQADYAAYGYYDEVKVYDQALTPAEVAIVHDPVTNASNNYFSGLLDEIAIYDFALTTPDVNVLYVASGGESNWGNQLTLYKDGDLVDQVQSTQGMQAATNVFEVGNGLTADIDDVTFWNQALSAGQVAADVAPINESVSNLVLAEGPVAYWKLDETVRGIAYDSSGNGIDLESNGEGYQTGLRGLGDYLGTSYQIDDGTTFVSYDSQLKITGDLTVLVFVDPQVSSNGADDHVILSWSYDGSGIDSSRHESYGCAYSLWITYTSNDPAQPKLVFSHNKLVDGDVTSISPQFAIDLSKSVMVAATRTVAGEIALYIDGAEVFSSSGFTDQVVSAEKGSFWLGGEGFAGRLDNVAVFGKALSGAIISNIYDVSRIATDPGHTMYSSDLSLSTSLGTVDLVEVWPADDMLSSTSIGGSGISLNTSATVDIYNLNVVCFPIIQNSNIAVNGLHDSSFEDLVSSTWLTNSEIDVTGNVDVTPRYLNSYTAIQTHTIDAGATHTISSNSVTSPVSIDAAGINLFDTHEISTEEAFLGSYLETSGITNLSWIRISVNRVTIIPTIQTSSIVNYGAIDSFIDNLSSSTTLGTSNYYVPAVIDAEHDAVVSATSIETSGISIEGTLSSNDLHSTIRLDKSYYDDGSLRSDDGFCAVNLGTHTIALSKTVDQANPKCATTIQHMTWYEFVPVENQNLLSNATLSDSGFSYAYLRDCVDLASSTSITESSIESITGLKSDNAVSSTELDTVAIDREDSPSTIRLRTFLSSSSIIIGHSLIIDDILVPTTVSYSWIPKRRLRVLSPSTSEDYDQADIVIESHSTRYFLETNK